MNLRRKTLFILGALLLLAIALIIGLSYTVLIGSYSSFEEKSTRAAVESVLKAIEYEISLMEKTCGDWSRWDETYQFIIDKDPLYIQRNLNTQTMDNLDLELIVITDKDRNIVYSSGYNRNTQEFEALSDTDLQALLSTGYLFSHDQLISSRSGVLSFSEFPLLVVSEPVLQSTYEGPSVGYLIFGKYLSDDEIGKLSDITSLNLTIQRNPGNNVVSDSLSDIIVQIEGPNTITGYTLLPDIAGDRQFEIRVTSDRGVYNQGLTTISSFIALLVIISVIFIAAVLIFLDQLVLRRLTVLIDRARTRNADFEGGDDPLLRNRDELSELAYTLTPVFDHITRSEKELRESEERYRNVVESQTEFICRFTPDGRHLFANQAYCTYFGKTLEELLSGRFKASIYPDDKAWVRLHFASLTKGSPVATIEHRVIMPDREVRWQQWTDLAIFDSDGSVLEYQSVGRDITERIQSQENLQRVNEDLRLVLEQLTASEIELKETLRRSEESERKYRELADSLPEFVFEVDIDGKITFLNRLGFQVSGYQYQDLISGLDALTLIAPEDRHRMAENMQRVLAGERIAGLEYTGYRRDGSRFPIITYTVAVEKDGHVCGLRGFAIDITERKRMETSNRKLADIVQHTQTGIITGSQDIVDVINPAYALMHGYSPEEIAGVQHLHLFSPELRKDFSMYLKRAEILGHVVFEADHLHRDGTIIPTLNDLTVIVDPDGSERYWILNVQDITEHRLAWKILMDSESLRESHRQLRDVISRLPDATFVIDKDGWVILWNSAMEQLTKLQSDSMIGRGQFEYSIPFYGEKRPMLIDVALNPSIDSTQYYLDMTRHGDTLSVEECLPGTVNGPMYLSAVANPLYDARGRVIGAIESIRDISARKRVEEALLKTNEKLNLLSSITRHDIRNRITVLFGILPLVKKMSDNPELIEMIQMLEKAAYAIRDQIEFTRDYQDLGVHAPEWRDAGDLLDLISHQGLLSEVRLENELHGLILYADPLLERVFYNLIDNAIRHGGQLSQITAFYVPDHQGLLVIFEDDGIGIPDDLKEQIFKRGYGKNTGLGLFLVREILSITGIVIQETGVYGVGARFEMLIPEGCYRFE
jgi:PAS domain S-box-containing protein